MASGKKNYFRHSMNARSDHKLRAFMDMFGRNWREGYFYFFTLLELCGSDAQDGKTEHTFHIKTLRDLWGTSTKGVQDVCNMCTRSALVMCKLSANDVTFSLPNLLNYTGKYSANAPNKEIKQIKENKEAPSTLITPEISEIKPKPRKKPKSNPALFSVEAPQLEEDMTIDQKASNVLTLFNALTFKNFRPVPGNMKHINARVNEGYSLEDFKKVIQFKYNEWINDPKFAHCVRPETILGNKFDSYLQSASNTRLQEIEDNKLIAQYFPGFSA